jgi:hypothetical protein
LPDSQTVRMKETGKLSALPGVHGSPVSSLESLPRTTGLLVAITANGDLMRRNVYSKTLYIL